MQKLSLENIHKTYGKKRILEAVSFTVNSGEVVGLLGPNGAGKTTLLKIVSGLTIPTAGRVSIAGAQHVYLPQEYWAKMAVVAQENNLEREFTVREALTSYAKLFGLAGVRQNVARQIKKFHMEEWQDVLVEKLSGGMARRAMIARGLLPDPELVLLDEPSVGLDPDMRQEIWKIIKELKAARKTVLLTTHYMEEAEALCDRIAFLKSGKLLALGTPQELKEIGAKVKQQPRITLEQAFLALTARKEDANGLVGCL